MLELDLKPGKYQVYVYLDEHGVLQYSYAKEQPLESEKHTCIAWTFEAFAIVGMATGVIISVPFLAIAAAIDCAKGLLSK